MVTGGWCSNWVNIKLAIKNIKIPFFLFAGINIFLDGYIKSENMRFRETSLNFKVSEKADDKNLSRTEFRQEYHAMTKTLGEIRL